MNNLADVLNQANEDIEAIKSWSSELYETRFSQYFKTQRQLYSRLQSRTHIITDEELESILTDIPLDLFSCAESLNELKLHHEVIKMKIKEVEIAVRMEMKPTGDFTATEIKEYALYKTFENTLVSTVLENLIVRVEKECSFSRELVMSAKKIWDRRRESEGAAGITSAGSAEPTVTLPDYDQMPAGSKFSSQTYIK